GGPRLDEAKKLASRVIDGLREQDLCAIIAAGVEPRVLCGLTGHQRTLKDAIAAAPATDGPTRVESAVAMARRLLADEKNPAIVTISAGCFDKPAELSRAEHVHFIPIGGRTGNVGITQFQVRRSLSDPLGYEILAEVANLSDDPTECRLEIDLEGDVLD